MRTSVYQRKYIRTGDCFRLCLSQFTENLRSKEKSELTVYAESRCENVGFTATVGPIVDSSRGIKISGLGAYNYIQQEFHLASSLIFNSQKIKYYFICSCGSRSTVLYLPLGLNQFHCYECGEIIYNSRSSYNYSKAKFSRNTESITKELDKISEGNFKLGSINKVLGALELRFKSDVNPMVLNAIQIIKSHLVCN